MPTFREVLEINEQYAIDNLKEDSGVKLLMLHFSKMDSTNLLISMDNEIPEDVYQDFLYGVDRTYMTLFGITVYGVVGLFLWPNREKNSIKDDAVVLSQTLFEYFESFDSDLLKKVFEIEATAPLTLLLG